MEMRTVCLGIAIAAVLSVGVSAVDQDPKEPPAKKTTPEKGDAIRVKGCLEGPTLESTETSMSDETGHVATAFTYQLRGDKKLLKQLRDEHDGKVVEVNGILKSDLPQDNAIRGKKLGKTKITVGLGATPTQRGGAAADPPLPVLEVKSYEGSGARCIR